MPKRRRNEEEQDSGAENDRDALLARLQAHGQTFMQSFSPTPSSGSLPRKRKRGQFPVETPTKHRLQEKVDDDEWQGISTHAGDELNDPATQSEDESDDESDAVIERDQSLREPEAAKAPRVVVFNGQSSSSREMLPAIDLPSCHETKEDEEEEQTEKTNRRNDIELHELIQTGLLTGTIDAGGPQRPADKRQQLVGRAMELAGNVKRGKGQKSLQSTELKRAPQFIRDGMSAKKAQRTAQQLEEAKNVGNYHPMIKHLLKGDDEKKRDRKRERGLGMGVGKFVGGTLKLTSRDLAKVRSPSSSGGGKHKGKR
ncbi:hypothetical protein BKA62DRAFT_749034 [Auriculariales sp. MPI-PUGE-AT-0066]|nr:hypothetical protein BKA62DRAFT_749034 [Auriculariales sp. MPI-PUGE-AT-0066]